MRSYLRFFLIAAAVAATIAFAACSDSGNDDDGGDGNQPVATEDTSDGSSDDENVPTEDSDDGSSGSSSGDIPVPDGASEQGSGTYSGSQIPFVVPNADFDADAYGEVEWTLYELDDSPSDVIEFYRDEFGDWDEVFSGFAGSDGEEGGYGVWTSDDGNTAVWLGVSASGGSTQLTLVVGRVGD
jgi:hypothetical protein